MSADTALQQRINAAVAIAEIYGSIDGAHHKQWVIDQMLQHLLGDGYAQWRTQYDAFADDDNEPYDPWDAGIAP